jgi:hypothetical protein
MSPSEWDDEPQQPARVYPKLELPEPVTEENQSVQRLYEKALTRIYNLEQSLTEAWKMIRERDAEIANLRRQKEPWQR